MQARVVHQDDGNQFINGQNIQRRRVALLNRQQTFKERTETGSASIDKEGGTLT